MTPECEKGAKCIVHKCSNHTYEGTFIGAMCAPCFHHITTGEIGPTDSFLYELTTLRSKLSACQQQLEKAQEALRMVYDQYIDAEADDSSWDWEAWSKKAEKALNEKL